MPIELIDTIKPKNDGAFPMVEAEDVVVGKGTEDEKRLPEALDGKADAAHTHTQNDVEGLADALATAGLVKGIDENIPYPYTNRPGWIPSTDCLRNYCANRNTHSVVGQNSWQFCTSGNSTYAMIIKINENESGHVVFDGWGRFGGTYTLANVEEVEAKQDKLVAGEGITIAEDGKTISATGGGGAEVEITTLPSTKITADGRWLYVEGNVGYLKVEWDSNFAVTVPTREALANLQPLAGTATLAEVIAAYNALLSALKGTGA